MTESPRILLVVTGRLEEVALGDALHRLFPTAEFTTRWTQGFTSTKVFHPPKTAEKELKVEGIVEKLLGAALAVEPGGQPFDYAIGFEDVELENESEMEPPDLGVERIVAHFLYGVDVVLGRHAASQQTIVLPKGKAKKFPPLMTDAERRRFLRERCSFHLFRPMPEAMFFGEPRGVQNAAGAGAELPPVYFDPSVCDIEAFRTLDPTYLAHPMNSAPWAKPRRERHPKHYLEYLLDPSGTRLRPYLEKEHGARALRALAWETVVAHADHARMVRALLEDVADMVGTPLEWIAAQPLHPLTCRKKNGRLRNLL